MSPAHPFLHKKVVEASWKILGERRYDIKPILPVDNPFENNLNGIVRQFLKSDCDFWLSIDHDNPPIGNPLDNVERDLDVVGYPTPVWHYVGLKGERPLYYNGYDYVSEKDAYKEHQPREGLQSVDAIGTGCFMVARRVFEHPNMTSGAFLREWDELGIVRKGNDIMFCERARAAGFRIWADYDRPCMHFNILELNEVVAAFKGLYEDATQ